MKERPVVFAPEALDDLISIYDWIAENADYATALNYVERIETYCGNLGLASERGQARDDIRPGLRVVGFERRVTVAFVVEADRVVILRLHYGGQNWDQ